MSPKVPKGYKIILVLGLASLVLLPVLSMLVVDMRRFPQIPALVAGITMFCFLAVALGYGAFYLLRPEPALDWADLLQSLAIETVDPIRLQDLVRRGRRKMLWVFFLIAYLALGLTFAGLVFAFSDSLILFYFVLGTSPVVMIVLLRMAMRQSAEHMHLFELLGLAPAEFSEFTSPDGNLLYPNMSFRGTRHGREVEVHFVATECYTVLRVSAARFVLKAISPRALQRSDAPLNLQIFFQALPPLRRFKNIQIHSGPQGLVVCGPSMSMQGWVYDLWLLEQLALQLG